MYDFQSSLEMGKILMNSWTFQCLFELSLQAFSVLPVAELVSDVDDDEGCSMMLMLYAKERRQEPKIKGDLWVRVIPWQQSATAVFFIENMTFLMRTWLEVNDKKPGLPFAFHVKSDQPMFLPITCLI